MRQKIDDAYHSFFSETGKHPTHLIVCDTEKDEILHQILDYNCENKMTGGFHVVWEVAIVPTSGLDKGQFFFVSNLKR